MSVSLEDQIAVVRGWLETDPQNKYAQGILASLRRLKAIDNTKLPEPVAIVTFSSNLSGVTVQPLPGASSALATDDKLYGPEVVEMLAAAEARFVGYEREADRLSGLVIDERRRADLAESRLKALTEGLREPSEEMLSAGYALQHEPAHGVDDIWKAMSAALLREIK